MKYLLLIFFLLSTFLLFSEGLKKDPKTIPSNLISKNIPSFSLKGLNNNSFSDKDLRNSELKLVNFFASWCPPCKVEHKNLVTLSKKIKIYGIAKKDKEDDVKIWFLDNGNPYQSVGLDFNGLASIEWGVYGLPETFLINKKNKIIHRHVGPITKNNLIQINEIIKNNK